MFQSPDCQVSLQPQQTRGCTVAAVAHSENTSDWITLQELTNHTQVNHFRAFRDTNARTLFKQFDSFNCDVSCGINSVVEYFNKLDCASKPTKDKIEGVKRHHQRFNHLNNVADLGSLQCAGLDDIYVNTAAVKPETADQIVCYSKANVQKVEDNNHVNASSEPPSADSDKDKNDDKPTPAQLNDIKDYYEKQVTYFLYELYILKCANLFLYQAVLFDYRSYNILDVSLY